MSDGGAIRRPLVGFDGSLGARAALRRGAELARANHGCLRVALVMGRPPCCAWPMAGIAETPEQYTRWQLEMLREAVGALEPDISVVSVACRGPAGPALARAAREGGCDAIVIGARRGLASRITGGVASRLRRTAEVPVIVVAADGGSAPRHEGGAELVPGVIRVRTV